jgi:hypothetical protein
LAVPILLNTLIAEALSAYLDDKEVEPIPER